jgi:hypothetical protein
MLTDNLKAAESQERELFDLLQRRAAGRECHRVMICSQDHDQVEPPDPGTRVMTRNTLSGSCGADLQESTTEETSRVVADLIDLTAGVSEPSLQGLKGGSADNSSMHQQAASNFKPPAANSLKAERVAAHNVLCNDLGSSTYSFANYLVYR